MKAGRFTLIVQRKLKNKNGASLSIALLIFLLCATVGSVVLAAANTSFGTMVDKKERDQEKYTIVSAAETFRDRAETTMIEVNSIDTDTALSDQFDNQLYQLIQKKGGTIDMTMTVNGMDPVKAKLTMPAFNTDSSAGSYTVSFQLKDDATMKASIQMDGRCTTTTGSKLVKGDQIPFTVKKYSWTAEEIRIGEADAG